MRHLAFLLFALVGAATVGVALPPADVTRKARAADDSLLFVPDGEQLRLASSGFEEALADLVWVRAVLIFGDRYETESGDDWRIWLLRTVRAVNTLNPTWRTAYFYGGTLLRVEGDIDGSDLVFADGAANLPNDPFFPFSIGMNAYIYRNDPATAAIHIRRASELPGAPAWYAASAAAMQQSAGARESAIEFLREVAAETDSPAVRKETELQLSRLRHNQLVDDWSGVCRDFWTTNGRRLVSPAELERLVGRPLPENPRGDGWTVGGDGIVRSPGAEKERIRRARQGEWRFIDRN